MAKIINAFKDLYYYFEKIVKHSIYIINNSKYANYRIMEFILHILVFVYISFNNSNTSTWIDNNFNYFISIFIFILLILHITIERPRFQLIMLYVLLIWITYEKLMNHTYDNNIIIIIKIILILLSYLFSQIIMPCSILLNPTGPYNYTGTKKMFINDIQVTMFYPITENKNIFTSFYRANYINNIGSDGLAKFLGFPLVLFRFLTIVKLNSYNNGPIPSKTHLSDDKLFPLIIFSHGLGGTSELYSLFSEELASHGFFVFLPTHQDGSAGAAINSNGKIKWYESLDENILGPSLLRSKRIEQLDIRVQEINILINYLNQQHHNWPIDINKIAFIGHSFGAATALKLGIENGEKDIVDPNNNNKKFVCICHDIWMYPITDNLLNKGPPHDIPYLFTLSDTFHNYEPNMNAIKHFVSSNKKKDKKNKNILIAHLKNSGHSNFSDPSLFSPFIAKLLKQIGSIHFRKGIREINKLQLNFIAKNLNLPSNHSAHSISLSHSNRNGLRQGLSSSFINDLQEDFNQVNKDHNDQFLFDLTYSEFKQVNI